MKRLVLITGIVLLVAAISGLSGPLQSAMGQDQVTAQEVKQKVQEAAQYLSEKGEEALPEFCDPNGRWAWKGTYVFVNDFDGNILGHSNPPSHVGKNIMGLKDVKGNMYAAEFVLIAKSDKGSGWLEYWWPKPGEQEPSLKAVYIMRVPGKDWLAGAGIYDVSKEEAMKAAGD